MRQNMSVSLPKASRFTKFAQRPITWPRMRPDEAASSVAPKRIFFTWLQTMTVSTPAIVPPYMAMPPSQILKTSQKLSLYLSHSAMT